MSARKAPSTGSGRALSPLLAALVRAFCPGAGSTLRECRSTEWASLTTTGARVVLEYDLPNPATRCRAFAIIKRAGMEMLALPGAILADAEARVRGDILSVEALVVFDAAASGGSGQWQRHAVGGRD